jgi:hypothetical protein
MANCAPKTPPTGCLDVTIQESIILPNYNLQQSYNNLQYVELITMLLEQM